MVKRKYTKLKKKGEGWELTKILSYAIGLIVFFAVIFAFYTNAPAITKGLKSLQTKGVELVEGVKTILDDTFKLLDSDGKKRRIERILTEYGS
jgi:predicted membrane-bound mannosyltransferase